VRQSASLLAGGLGVAVHGFELLVDTINKGRRKEATFFQAAGV
jgi:hypothetical protein